MMSSVNIRNPSLTTFTIMVVVLLAVAMLVSAFVLGDYWLSGDIGRDTRDGAKEALGLMKDSFVWMASIQTATIAALGLLSKEGALALQLSSVQQRLVVLIATCNTAALFFSAWILTALPSIMLRVYENGTTAFDIYDFTLYEYLGQYNGWDHFTLGFFTFWNHWLWGAGILFFGVFVVSIIAAKEPKSRDSNPIANTDLRSIVTVSAQPGDALDQQQPASPPVASP